MKKIKIINFFQQTTEVTLWLVIFFIPISVALVNIGIGFAIFFWLARKILSKDWQITGSFIIISLMLLLAIALFSMLNTINATASFKGITKLFKYLFLFLTITETINNKTKLSRVIWAALLGLGLISLDGFFQYFMGKDFIRGYSLWPGLRYAGEMAPLRVRASMHNPNSLAVYLITLIPMLLSFIFYYLKGKKRWLLIFVGLIAVFCLFNTYQRISAAGFLIIAVLFSVIKKDKRLLFLLLCVVILSVSFLPKTIIKWALDHPNPYDFFVEEGGRRLHWQAAVNMIKSHPCIGVGINTFSINYNRYKVFPDFYSGSYAHNSYLHLAAEIGLIGFGIFILMIICVIKGWWRSYRIINTPDLQAISLGIFGGVIGNLISGILESNLQVSSLAVLFWFILSLMYTSFSIASNELYSR